MTERYEYSAGAGQRVYDRNGANKGRGLKIGSPHALVSYIEKKIEEEKMSPYAALQSIKNEGKEFAVSICLKTLYNYIEQGLFLNISQKDLPQGGKRKTRNYDKIRRAHNNTTGTSITEMPEEIERRSDFGHWEPDTVVGKARTKAVLLILTERKTRYELIYKLEGKTKKAVVSTPDRLERKLGKKRFCRIKHNHVYRRSNRFLKGFYISGKRSNIHYLRASRVACVMDTYIQTIVEFVISLVLNAKAVVDNDTKSSQTGDNSHMALRIALLLVSGGALIGTTVISKKRKRSAR